MARTVHVHIHRVASADSGWEEGKHPRGEHGQFARASNGALSVPDWAFPEKPGPLALHETIALSGMEGKWVRLDATSQRRILGANVFGKQEMRLKDGVLSVRRSVGFGVDSETAEYSVERIAHAISTKKKLSPGVTGPGYA